MYLSDTTILRPTTVLQSHEVLEVVDAHGSEESTLAGVCEMAARFGACFALFAALTVPRELRYPLTKTVWAFLILRAIHREGVALEETG
jgi:tellurite resistance protein TehA-like permease